MFASDFKADLLAGRAAHPMFWDGVSHFVIRLFCARAQLDAKASRVVVILNVTFVHD